MQSEKITAPHTIGLQIEEHHLKAVHLAYKKGEVFLEDLYHIDLSNEESDHPFSSSEKGKQLLQQLKSTHSLSAISGSETLVRSLFVQLKKARDIDSVITFQAEPLLPFNEGEAVVDWIRQSSEEKGSELTIFAVRKEQVAAHLEQFEKLGIDPDSVSSVPVAILSFAGAFTEEKAPYFFCHIGAKNSTCGLVSEGKLLAVQYHPRGFESLLQSIREDRALSEEEGVEAIQSLELSSIDQKEYPSFSKAYQNLRTEILKILYALAKQLKSGEAKRLLVTGEGGSIPSLRHQLCHDLHMEEIKPHAQGHFEIPEAALLRHVVPIGLALSALPTSKEQINFRKEELAHPNPFKRLIKPLGFYLGACLLLVLGVYLYSLASMGSQEDALKQQFGNLLASMDKPYAEFELNYENKYGEFDGRIIPLESLSVQDLMNRLEYLEKEVDSAPQPIALMPNTPRVSDVLAWLSTHPNVVLAGDERGVRKPLIQIEHMNYAMVKRPEEKKRNLRYQLKVELEFTSPTPKLAREFHDALIEDNSMVDPKAEVKWSSSRGKYRTSFFLKDRTYYP